MTHLGFASPDEETPMPKVDRACTICQPTDEEILAGRVLVSPHGVAHHSDGYDKTACGKDATPNGWWWPL